MNIKVCMRSQLITSIIAVAVLTACGDTTEIGRAQDVEAEAVFIDYKVSADETAGLATFNATYRFGGPNGTTLLLESPASVLLDGDSLAADSSGMGGVFYEHSEAIEDFAGKHSVAFVNGEGKRREESFEFRPVQLLPPGEGPLPRGALRFRLNGVTADSSLVRVTLTDTSDGDTWINEDFTVRSGSFEIGEELVRRLKPGPLFMQVQWEQQLPLKQPTREGGRMRLIYALQKELELAD